MTNAAQYLDELHRAVTAPAEENNAVRDALDRVVTLLQSAGAAFAVAEQHRCGSYAKATMLRGRREGDLVIVLANPPDEAALDRLQGVLDRGLSAELIGHPSRNFKSVELHFRSGAKVDVLPVAQHGRTADAHLAPEKLRHAQSGRKHVEWFKVNAHGKAIHPTTRLIKRWRDFWPAAAKVPSFALEVVAVNTLRGRDSLRLDQAFEAVLEALATGVLDGSLPDPVDAHNDVLAKLAPLDRQRAKEAAGKALAAWRRGDWKGAVA